MQAIGPEQASKINALKLKVQECERSVWTSVFWQQRKQAGIENDDDQKMPQEDILKALGLHNVGLKMEAVSVWSADYMRAGWQMLHD